MSKTYIEISGHLLEGIDDMIGEGFYSDRTEGVNDAVRLLLKNFKISKLHEKDSLVFREKKKNQL